ncbi:MAG: BrnA antitoxin family protein [Nitrospinota bacterium]
MKRKKKANNNEIPEISDEQFRKMKPLAEVFPQITGKSRITIRIDNNIIDWFKIHAKSGSYQGMINAALREYIKNRKEPLEDTLRRVIREELKKR